MPCPYNLSLFFYTTDVVQIGENCCNLKSKIDTADCQFVRYRLSLIVGALALPCPEART